LVLGSLFLAVLGTCVLVTAGTKDPGRRTARDRRTRHQGLPPAQIRKTL